jgi:YVTN family beta-propeller protein
MPGLFVNVTMRYGLMRKALIGSCVAAVIVAAASAFVWTTVGASGPPLPLQTLLDVPLVGGTGRLDYESLDDLHDRLYISHLGADSVIVFDTARNRVITSIGGTPSVRGVLAVPELNRVYAAAQGSQDVVVIDAATNAVLARVKAGDVDGLAYDPRTRQVFVSDESGGRDAVIDTATNRLVATIALGGQAGNTQYDDFTHRIVVAVQTSNELVEIDPRSRTIVRRFSLPGCVHGHGVAIDSAHRFAYVACQVNSAIVRLNLATGRVDAHASVGIGADVLAIDFGADRLYIASESGIVTVFDIRNRTFKKIGQAFYAPGAHVVAVQARSHRTYFPLANVDGRPVLRIALPAFPRPS